MPTLSPIPRLTLAAAIAMTLATAQAQPAENAPHPRRAEVVAAEAAFAQSMAERDFAAFSRHVADDAVFLNGGKPLRGKAAVLAHWKKFFDGPNAPFTWKPELVEANMSGEFGSTTGPVTTPEGKIVARFYSTWRREGDGSWRIIFDNGYDADK